MAMLPSPRLQNTNQVSASSSEYLEDPSCVKLTRLAGKEQEDTLPCPDAVVLEKQHDDEWKGYRKDLATNGEYPERTLPSWLAIESID